MKWVMLGMAVLTAWAPAASATPACLGGSNSADLQCGWASLGEFRLVGEPEPERAGSRMRQPGRDLRVIASFELSRLTGKRASGSRGPAEPLAAGTIGAGLLLVGWAYRKPGRP